jgi:hypothetical protein
VISLLSSNVQHLQRWLVYIDSNMVRAGVVTVQPADTQQFPRDPESADAVREY